jgi:hypothetical protein
LWYPRVNRDNLEKETDVVDRALFLQLKVCVARGVVDLQRFVRMMRPATTQLKMVERTRDANERKKPLVGRQHRRQVRARKRRGMGSAIKVIKADC